MGASDNIVPALLINTSTDPKIAMVSSKIRAPSISLIISAAMTSTFFADPRSLAAFSKVVLLRPTRTIPFAPAVLQALAIPYSFSVLLLALEVACSRERPTNPIPPAAPVIMTTFPEALSSGLVGSTAG